MDLPTRAMRASSLASLGRWTNAGKRAAPGSLSDEHNSEGTQSDTESAGGVPPAKRSRKVAKSGPANKGAKGVEVKDEAGSSSTGSRQSSVDAIFVNALHAAAEAAGDESRGLHEFSPDDATIDGILQDLDEAEMPPTGKCAVGPSPRATAAAPPPSANAANAGFAAASAYFAGGMGVPRRPSLEPPRDQRAAAFAGERDPYSPLFSGLRMDAGTRSTSFTLDQVGDLNHPAHSIFLGDPMEGHGAHLSHGYGYGDFHALGGAGFAPQEVRHSSPTEMDGHGSCASGSINGGSAHGSPPRHGIPPVTVTARTMPHGLAGTMPTAAAVLVSPAGSCSSRTSCTSLASLGSQPSYASSAASVAAAPSAAPPPAKAPPKKAKCESAANANSAGANNADGNRKEWSAWEDETIRNGVLKLGSRWRVIAAELPGRSDDAVRNRWARLQQTITAPNGVKPPSAPRVRREGGEQRQSWTVEEDDIISSSVLEYGHRWNKIAERLPRRTEHAIRNRWHRLQMRSLEGLEGLDADGITSVGIAPIPKASPPMSMAPAAAAPAPAAATRKPKARPAPADGAPAPAPVYPTVGRQGPMLLGEPGGLEEARGLVEYDGSAAVDVEEELGELPSGFDFDSVISL